MFKQNSARLLAGAMAVAFAATGCVEGPPPLVEPEPASTYEAVVRVDFPVMTPDDPETEENESVLVLDENGDMVIEGSVYIPFNGEAEVDSTDEL